MKQPKERSRLRMLLGQMYYRLRKWGYWYLSPTLFSVHQQKENLPHQIFPHQTPLMRDLRAVDEDLQRNKVENIRKAVSYLDGLVIRPGETFSYWRQIGNPTAGKGYREGMVLYNGTVQRGIGGGLCQLSNLIYWMTLHTPLTIIERWRHGYDVFPDSGRTQPFGSGATCSYPAIDLQIRNGTMQSFQMRFHLTAEALQGVYFSDAPLMVRYEVCEADHRFEAEWWGGYTRHNRLYRRVFSKADGIWLYDEPVAENHALMMYTPILPKEPL